MLHSITTVPQLALLSQYHHHESHVITEMRLLYSSGSGEVRTDLFVCRFPKKRRKKKSQSPSLPIQRSHSYLQATSAWPWSLIKAKGCPDLSPFPLKCSVLCCGRKSLAAWFNEPSVEPADLMTCENINLLPPRALLLRKQSIIHSGAPVEPYPSVVPRH